MDQYYVWLTAPKSDFFSDLTGHLLRRGYTVSPLGRTGILSYADKPAHVIALSLARTPKTDEETTAYAPSGIHDEVMDVIKILKVKVYSIVVCKACGCTWNTGNMSLAAMEAEDMKRRGIINLELSQCKLDNYGCSVPPWPLRKCCTIIISSSRC